MRALIQTRVDNAPSHCIINQCLISIWVISLAQTEVRNFLLLFKVLIHANLNQALIYDALIRSNGVCTINAPNQFIRNT